MQQPEEQKAEIEQESEQSFVDKEIDEDIALLSHLDIIDKSTINYTWDLDIDSLSFDQ